MFFICILNLAAKTPKVAKTPGKSIKKSVKKSVKKRTWADVAKKTPAPKAKANLTGKMAAHVQKQQRRKSGQALPTFRMVSFKLDFIM